MATLETQYKDFLLENKDSTFTFEEWKQHHGNKILTAINREEHLKETFPTEDGKTYIQSLDEFNSKPKKDEMSSRWQDIMREINTPEYKEKVIKDRKEKKEKLTSEYQFGFYVGEQIATHSLPTITTDMIKSRTQIKVSDEDTLESERLHDEWWDIGKYGKNPDPSMVDEKWKTYRQHYVTLEKKYLPNPFKSHMGLMNIRDEKEFKKGLIHSLWNCDMCTYSLKPEDIKIYDDEDLWFTVIEFVLRDEE
jgi:hypothetical protein